MNTFLLIAGLALPVTAHAQAATRTTAQVEALAAHWQDVQAETSRMDTEFRANIRRDSPDQADGVLKQLDGDWAYRAKIVRGLQDWRSSLSARYRAQAVAGIMESSEAQRRVDYIERLFRLRMLQIYGNLTPLAFTEATDSDGNAVGNRWIGPSWRVAVELSDVRQAYQDLEAQSGIPTEDMPDDPNP